MNKFIVTGNLVRDPESFTTPNGVSYTKFTLAVNRPFTNADGKRDADYFDIIAWRQLGDRCAKYLFKGSKCGVVGSIQQQQYTDKNGIKRTSYQVVADEVEFLSQKPQGGNNISGSQTSNFDKNKSIESRQQSMFDGMQEVDPQDLPF